MTDSELVRREVREAVFSRRVPARLSRAYQERLMRRGRLGYRSHTLEPMAAARRAVLGERAGAGPRLLVRLGPFPGGAPQPTRLRELAAAGLPYLLAVDASRPLRDDEAELLADLRRAGVAFALHGPAPALSGRSAEAVGEALDAAEARLTEGAAIRPDVLVAPALNHRHWDALAVRYSVIAADARAVRDMGYQSTPLFRGEAVWLPAYEGGAGDLAGAAGAWVPVVAGDGADAAALAPHAASWEDFLEAVRRARG